MCLVGRLIAILMIFTLGACGSKCESSMLQPGALPVSNTKNQHSDVDHGESTYTDQQCYQPSRNATSKEAKIDWGKTAAVAVVAVFIGAIIVVAIVEPKALEGLEEIGRALQKTSKRKKPNEPPKEDEDEPISTPPWTPARS